MERAAAKDDWSADVNEINCISDLLSIIFWEMHLSIRETVQHITICKTVICFNNCCVD